MSYKDLIITPVVLAIILSVAYLLRDRFTNADTKRYFMPALIVRLFGAISVGLIYQFYYQGGDTFNYHTNGSLHVWRALLEKPAQGIQLLLASGGDYFEAFQYSSAIWYYRDPASYMVIKLAAIFDVFTFGTYSATACLFAVLSFVGAWALFTTFNSKYPTIHKYLALSVLFVPSVFFWGSGLFKDTITLAMIGLLIYSVDKLFLKSRFNISYLLILIISSYIIYKIKIYQLLVILPCLIFWVFYSRFREIRNIIIRILSGPIVLFLILFLGYLGIMRVAENNPRYSLDKIAKTARITAYDIRYGWGARDGIGSGYDIGIPDGTILGMLKIAPAAVNVTLFRPYPFEIQNPLMVLASIESTILLLLSLYILFKLFTSRRIIEIIAKPDIFFCLFFSIVFAFAVGASTFNFGTLVRYKLPVMPLYLVSISLIYSFLTKKIN